MTQIVKRGYMIKDEIEFGDGWKIKLNNAATEMYFLINHGYDIKSTSTFIGNHYMLSQRQRMALARMVSTKEQLLIRKNKELSISNLTKKVYIDGFNTIITLEVALSSSLLIKGMDNTIRDLAGLRGNYRIIDKTKLAIKLILKTLDELGIEESVIYLDRPVSNSGRLKALIDEMALDYYVKVIVDIVFDVDRKLEKHEGVITSDSIILDNCISWFNLNRRIVEKNIEMPWIFHIDLQ